MLLSAGVAAHADTVSIFNLQHQSGSGNVGTVTIDTTIGSVLDFNVSVLVGSTTELFNIAPGTQRYNPLLNEYQATVTEGGSEFLFQLPVTTLVGYAPGDAAACKTSAVRCDYLANIFNGPMSRTNPPADTFEGNLIQRSTPTTVTPEPGSIALFGTGLLGLAGAVRRRRLA